MGFLIVNDVLYFYLNVVKWLKRNIIVDRVVKFIEILEILLRVEKSFCIIIVELINNDGELGLNRNIVLVVDVINGI